MVTSTVLAGRRGRKGSLRRHKMGRPLLLALSIVCVHRIGIHTKWEMAAAATAAVKSSQSELPFLQGSWTIDSSTITYFTFTHNHSQINPFLNF